MQPTYFWTEDLESYLDALAWRGAGHVPLLWTDHAGRRARWRAVLEWYGLVGAEGPPPGPQPSLPRASGRDLVVALEPQLRELAAKIAATQARPFVDASAGFDPAAFQREHAPTSAWLFGAPANFGCVEVDALGQSLTCPWGLSTAPDLATLTFVLAKLAAPTASDPRRDRWTNCDVLRRRVESSGSAGGSGGEKIAIPIDEALSRALFEHEHRLLTISAHGESSHVSLQSIVLCALVDDCEADLDGRPIDGCRRVDGALHCKRVPPGARRLCAVTDLQAIDLALMTCSGFCVAGDQYPSTSSLVHAAAQGYARSLLTTRESLPVRGWVGRCITELGRRGATMGSIQALGNELLAHRQGRRPWVLFGDPAPGPALARALDLGAEFETTGEIQVFALPSPAPALLRSSAPIGELVRSHAHVLIIPEHRGPRPTARLVDAGPEHRGPRPTARLVDAGPEHREQDRQLASWLGRLDSAAQVERALGCHLASHRHEAALDTAMSALTRERARLELLHQAGLTLFEDARAHGTWAPRLGQLLTQLDRAAAAWQDQLAAMLEEFLLLDQFETTLLAGTRRQAWDPGAPCPRCGVALKGARALDPMRGLAPRLRASCPNCDYLELRPEQAASLEVRLPATLRDAQPCTIEVELRHAPGPGVLVAALVDKGSGEPMFRGRERVTTTRHRFCFELPARVSATLHVLELAWVCDLDLSLMRLRSPGAPRYQE